MQTVVLLHGGGPGADAETNWRLARPRLTERGFRVIAPDLVGFGAAAHPDPGLDGPGAYLDARVEQVLGLLDEAGVERASLVGNSLGGALSLRLVTRHPERIEKVVLMGSAGAPLPPTEELIELVTFYQRGTHEAMKRLMELFVYDTSILGTDLDELAATRLAAASRPEVRRSYEAMFPPDPEAFKQLRYSEDELRAIEQPVLLIHGQHDRMIKVEASHWMYDRIPNADLHIFKRCGHWAQLERPGEFEGVVEAFLTA